MERESEGSDVGPPEPSVGDPATSGWTRFLEALSFAAKRHQDQRRKGDQPVPYINHPIQVALLLAGVGGVQDQELLCAAVLHDVLEDTETTADKISDVSDIATAPPTGWSRERRDKYLDWAEAVVRGCRGVNVALDAAFDDRLERARAAVAARG